MYAPRAVRNFHETGGNSVREIRHGEHARERERQGGGEERTRSIGTAGREAKERENRIYSMLVKDVLSKHGTNLREKRTLKVNRITQQETRKVSENMRYTGRWERKREIEGNTQENGRDAAR